MKTSSNNQPQTCSRVPFFAAESGLFYVALSAAILIFVLMALPSFRGLVYTYNDLGDYHLPMRSFYAKCLASGEDFVWLPNIFCGFYIHGDGSVGMYHPLHLLLYRILPLGAAFNIELLFSYPFAMVGMFLFLRRWRIPRDAAMLGALVFAFSGFNIQHYMHINAVAVGSHVPWLLFSIDVVMRESDRRRAAFAGFCVALLTASQLLLGHPQMFWFSSLVEFLYAMSLAFSGVTRARLLSLGISKILGILMGGIQLLPTLEAVAASRRGDPSTGFLLWPSVRPVHALQLVAPYFFNAVAFEGIPHELKIYDGAIPLVLLAMLLVRRKHALFQNRFMKLALGLGAMSLVLLLGENGYIAGFLSFLPLVGLFRAPCRYSFVLHFVLAMGTAFAFSDLSSFNRDGNQLPWRKLWPLFLFPLASFLPPLVSLLGGRFSHPIVEYYFMRNVASKGMALAGPILFTLAAALVVMGLRGFRYARFAIIVFVAADMGMYGLSVFGADGISNVNSIVDSLPSVSQTSGYRIQSRDNILIMKGLRLADGYAGLMPAQQLQNLNPIRMRVAGVGWFLSNDANLYGERTFGQRVLGDLPRVRLTAKALVGSNMDRDIRTIDPETTALVSEKIDLPEGRAGKAEILTDRPGKITMIAEAESKQLLVLSESYNKGWHARVDGNESPVMRVYGDFMGCIVSAGRHEVEFTFRPKSLVAGQWISALGLGLSAVSFLISILGLPAAISSRVER